MKTISLRIEEQDEKLLKNYVKANNLSLSEFMRNAIMEKIEDDLKLDEKRILRALEKAQKEDAIPHDEFWKRIGV